MGFMSLIANATSLILQYPFEKHIKPDRDKLDKLYEELKTSLLKQQKKLPLQEIVRREQTGDYCVSCVPSKHLMRVKDALTDAMNIANDKGFNEVAEGKIQQAVLELNGAEKDLEMAQIPEEIRPATDELKNQIRKLRSFLRQDQSGLELVTAFPPEQYDDMKKSLEVANQVTDMLIKYGYDVSKLQMKTRAEASLT